jgi:hypothetical protein
MNVVYASRWVFVSESSKNEHARHALEPAGNDGSASTPTRAALDSEGLAAIPLAPPLHGWNGPQEVRYKDIVVETLPKEDKLITLKR